jgi:hypothetical protein
MPSLTPAERRRRVLLISCGFARNLAIYRCGQRVGRPLLKKEGARSFWREVNSTCLDIAVLEWCKLFADSGGKHSWKRVIASRDQVRFERELKSAMGQNSRQHASYVALIRDYRDKFIAHLDDDRAMQIPHMEPARHAVWYLYGYLVKNECQPNEFSGLPDSKSKFENSYQHFVSQVEQVFIGAL